jgi:Flp pilus assembly pilin Flp
MIAFVRIQSLPPPPHQLFLGTQNSIHRHLSIVHSSRLSATSLQDSPAAEAYSFRDYELVWNQDDGQDIAEYAVMLAVVLVILVGTVRLIGANASNIFSSVGSAIQ